MSLKDSQKNNIILSVNCSLSSRQSKKTKRFVRFSLELALRGDRERNFLYLLLQVLSLYFSCFIINLFSISLIHVLNTNTFIFLWSSLIYFLDILYSIYQKTFVFLLLVYGFLHRKTLD